MPFAPVDLYLTTAEELWFPLGELIPGLLLLALAVFLAVSLLAVFLPTKLSVAFRAAVYAFSFLLYLQGNLLVIDYGTLNGAEVQWSDYTLRYILDAALWIAVIALFIFLMFQFRKKFRNVVEIAACVLLITQVISIGVFLVQHGTAQKEEVKRYLSVKGEFEISEQQNTVVFVLDTLDSRLFEELRNKYPEEIEEGFTDFTFFPDTVGGATRTKYAIPFILTGDTNKEDQSYTEYLAAGFERSVLTRELAAEKADTGIYSISNYIDLQRDDVIGNIATGSAKVSDHAGLTKQFMRLVALRYAPSVLAQRFWMYTGDFEAYKSAAGEAAYALDDVRFYQELTEKQLTVSGNQPVFRFYHLKGAHAPYGMDEECNRVSGDGSTEEKQTLGALRIVREYLRQLKKLGIYDKTTVVVMADHGFEAYSSVEQTPLFMMKVAGESHPFAVSDVPLYYGSMPEILAAAIKGEQIDPETWRYDGTRLFYQQSAEGNVNNLTEYAVEGTAWENKATATGTVYHENTLHLSRDYEPGTTVYFDERDTGRNYIVSGFSKNEGYFTWTDGKTVEMAFELPEVPGGALRLILEHGTNGQQHVEVFVNEISVGAYDASEEDHYTIPIPKGTVTENEFRLRLELPDACSSETDPRELGLSMKSLVIK